jgi:hypothetical protein
MNKVVIAGRQYERGTRKRDLTVSATTPMRMRPKKLARLIADTCAACQTADSASSYSGLRCARRAWAIDPALLISDTVLNEMT